MKTKMYLNLVLTFVLAYIVGLIASALMSVDFSDLERIGFGLILYFIYATIKSVKTVSKLQAAMLKIKREVEGQSASAAKGRKKMSEETKKK